MCKVYNFACSNLKTMSRTYKFANPEGLYYITFATVGWVDVFTRRQYKDILIESLNFCQKEKGLELYGYVIMTNHVHLIAKAKEDIGLSAIIRDFKKYTSKQVLKAIEENPQESRKEWMLRIFKKAGEYNSNNKDYQFWRQDNHPIELYKAETIQQKLDYIHNNPVEEGFVTVPEDYLYSSARNYAELDNLLEIDFI
jgi:REP element-mobilizing transposase RayT